MCLSVIVLLAPRVFSSGDVAEGYAAPLRTVLPQVDYVPTPPNQGWETVTQSIRQSPPQPPSVDAPNLTRWYDWRGNKQATCASYNSPYPPRSPQDCPDSSFSYVTAMSKYIPHAVGGGCIQLGHDAQNWCWTDEASQGQYDVWWDKVSTQTP